MGSEVDEVESAEVCEPTVEEMETTLIELEKTAAFLKQRINEMKGLTDGGKKT